MAERDLRQRQISSVELFREKITLRRDRVRAVATGLEFERVVVEHPGAVCVVPLTAAGEVLLVRQWRYAAGEALLEVVAGTLEPGEEPIDCADREIQEEAGVKAERLTLLGSFFSAPGFCTEILHVFLAEGLTESRLPADFDEDLEVVRLPLDEALAQAQSGGFRDAKTICALALAAGAKGR